jgi:hypothetical protein
MDCSRLACYASCGVQHRAVSDDREQPESDGLDALASGLQGNEADEAEEDLDLASLAAVVGARATSSGQQDASPATSDKLTIAGAEPAKATAPPAPAAAPASGRSMLVPALLVIAIGVGVGGYLLGRSSRPELAQIASPPAPAPAASPPSPQIEPPRGIAEAPLAAAPAAPKAPANAVQATADARPRAAPRPVDSTSKPVAVASAAPAPAAVAAVPAGAEPAEKPAEVTALAKSDPPNRSMDQLLDDALTLPALPGPGERRAAETAGAAALPEAPSRDEVTQAMAVLLPAIRGCAMGQTGLATAGIVVRGDGRVASVELTGAPFEGTASGRCMEGVLRRARFSRFRQPTFRVRFPFAIQ